MRDIGRYHLRALTPTTSTVIKGYSAVEGNDVAGDVVKIGSKVHDFKIKDKVAGFSKMATANKYGAYAEYTVSFVER